MSPNKIVEQCLEPILNFFKELYRIALAEIQTPEGKLNATIILAILFIDAIFNGAKHILWVLFGGLGSCIIATVSQARCKSRKITKNKDGSSTIEEKFE